jgi:hypothetical protein
MDGWKETGRKAGRREGGREEEERGEGAHLELLQRHAF